MIRGLSVGAVIAAGGRGTRMSGTKKKQFLDLAGKPIFIYTLQRFQTCPEVDRIVLVASEDDLSEMKDLAEEYCMTKVSDIVPGGAERRDSVWNGLVALDKHPVDLTVVHDAVRPFVDGALIRRVLSAASAEGAALAAVASKETVKVDDGTGFVKATPGRETVWMAQTPQAFRSALLRSAYEKARDDGYAGTDEAVVVERLGRKVKLVEGSYDNIKITTDEDLQLAGLIAKRWRDAG